MSNFQQELDEALALYGNELLEYGNLTAKDRLDNRTADSIRKRHRKAIIKAVIRALPEKLSIKNLYPEEKINRVEYAKFCQSYNQALQDTRQALNELRSK